MKDMKKKCWDPAKVFKVDLNEIAKEDLIKIVNQIAMSKINPKDKKK